MVTLLDLIDFAKEGPAPLLHVGPGAGGISPSFSVTSALPLCTLR